MKDTDRHERAATFKRRVDWWARKLNVSLRQVRIQRMTRKWASCSNSGWISFAEDLLNESCEFQKYVIVHELLHLHVPNHGKLWKSFMRSYVGYHKKIESRSLSLIS